MPDGPVPDHPVEESPAAPAAPVRRRGRTTLIVAGAAVLGLVAGTCAGYLVQAGRTPTKLPSLSQPVVHQAKGYVQPLTAAQDHRVKTDGDLRKLLLARPGGTQKGDYTGAWLDLSSYAGFFTKPNGAFLEELRDNFRRAAISSWHTDTMYVEIRLVQYRQDSDMSAPNHVEDQGYWQGREPATSSWSIPDTGDGMVWVHRRPRTKAGYLPEYTAAAMASRGDVVMEIFISDTKQVSKGRIMDLAKKQVARL